MSSVAPPSVSSMSEKKACAPLVEITVNRHRSLRAWKLWTTPQGCTPIHRGRGSAQRVLRSHRTSRLPQVALRERRSPPPRGDRGGRSTTFTGLHLETLEGGPPNRPDAL